MAIFKGACTALVTPMNEDCSVNYNKLDELIEMQIEAGIDALCICGTTGEASTLTHADHIKVIEHCFADIEFSYILERIQNMRSPNAIQILKEANRMWNEDLSLRKK